VSSHPTSHATHHRRRQHRPSPSQSSSSPREIGPDPGAVLTCKVVGTVCAQLSVKEAAWLHEQPDERQQRGAVEPLDPSPHRASFFFTHAVFSTLCGCSRWRARVWRLGIYVCALVLDEEGDKRLLVRGGATAANAGTLLLCKATIAVAASLASTSASVGAGLLVLDASTARRFSHSPESPIRLCGIPKRPSAALRRRRRDPEASSHTGPAWPPDAARLPKVKLSPAQICDLF